MDALDIFLFGLGMYLCGRVWTQLEVHSPDDAMDTPGTVAPSKGENII